jgi:hypothetical protein
MLRVNVVLFTTAPCANQSKQVFAGLVSKPKKPIFKITQLKALNGLWGVHPVHRVTCNPVKGSIIMNAQTLYTRAVTYNNAVKEIRAQVAENGDRVRISRDGEVNVYGRMPNSIVTGWWYAGDVQQAFNRLCSNDARIVD